MTRNIYILLVNEKDKTTYKTYEEAFVSAKKILYQNPNHKVKIYEEEYNDDLHCSDVSCKIYLKFFDRNITKLL